jgi:hypothetical protein
MRYKPIVSLIAVGLSSTLLLAGCADPATLAGGGSGCQRQFTGVTGVVQPETSSLSCADINHLFSAIPSKPESFLIQGDSPRLFWKCTFYGVDGPIILRCAYEKRRFSIVRSAK